MTTTAIRYVANTAKSVVGSIFLHCHVKPGCSKQREGVINLLDHAIIIGVAAPARDGEANRAVVNVLSGILQVPQGDINIVKGTKSRDKLVEVVDVSTQNEEELVEHIRQQLRDAFR